MAEGACGMCTDTVGILNVREHCTIGPAGGVSVARTAAYAGSSFSVAATAVRLGADRYRVGAGGSADCMAPGTGGSRSGRLVFIVRERMGDFQSPVDMQGRIDENSGVTVAGRVDVSVAAAGSPDGCRSWEPGRYGNAARMSRCRRWREAVTASACGRGNGRRKEGSSPDGGSIGAGSVAARHLRPMAVDIGALTGGIYVGRWCAAAGCQQRPAAERNRICLDCRGAGLSAVIMIEGACPQTGTGHTRGMTIGACKGHDSQPGRTDMGRVRLGVVRVAGTGRRRCVTGSAPARSCHRAGQVAGLTPRRCDACRCKRILVAAQTGKRTIHKGNTVTQERDGVRSANITVA
jgi:hypothetical protein